jgi:hypothetical protein
MINKRQELFVLLITLVVGCNSPNRPQEAVDGTVKLDKEAELFAIQAQKDSVLLAVTKDVLTAIKAKDYRKLAGHFHPEEGVRFSPYGYIDTVNHVHFTAEEFIKQSEDDPLISWGSYDGTGKDIQMSLKDYFGKFVYEVDFLNAEQTSVNEVLGKGNSLINIQQVYPGADFTESYFSGFNEKYGGMDWRSLRLVFKWEGEKPLLVGIVHDQWTI